MANGVIKSAFGYAKVATLTGVVIISFVMSSFGRRHIESTEESRLVAGAIILSTLYALIVFELVNRNLAALIGAAMSVAAYDCLVDFVDMDEIVQWVDLETLALLFGMMVIVNILAGSGLFDFLAIYCYQKSGGQFWTLVTILSILTAFLSAFIDNVSCMLLMSPTLIKLSELEHMDPRYILMIMAIISNIGGCATPVGDPPNLIIIGDSLVARLGLSFGTFVAYCAPGVAICTATTIIYLRLVYKSKDSFRLKQELDESVTAVEEGRQSVVVDVELTTYQGQPPIRKNSRLNDLEIEQLREKHSIKSKPILIQSLVILTAAVLLFFIQSLPGVNLTLGWVSLFAALTLLVTSSASSQSSEGHDPFDVVINGVEWSTLMFFFALFIVMEVMSKLGLILYIGNLITGLIDLAPSGQTRAVVAISIILWSSGIASAVVDNVPFTSMMIKVLGTMVAQSRSSGAGGALEALPLTFALVFGACLGGNGTLIGASANLVVASASGRAGYPITFNGFFKFAAPITLLTLFVANIYLVVVFVIFGAE